MPCGIFAAMCAQAFAYCDIVLILGGFVVGRWWMLLFGPACWVLLLYSCALMPAGAMQWLGQFRVAAEPVALGLVTRYMLRVFRRQRVEAGEPRVSRLVLLAIFAIGALGVQLGFHTYLYLVVKDPAGEAPWLSGPMAGFPALACGWLAALITRHTVSRRPELQRRIARRATAYLVVMAVMLVAVYAGRTGGAASGGALLLVVLIGAAIGTLGAPFFLVLWTGKSAMEIAAMSLTALALVGPLLLLIWSSTRATATSSAKT